MKTSAFILKSNLMLETEEMMVEKKDLSLMIINSSITEICSRNFLFDKVER